MALSHHHHNQLSSSSSQQKPKIIPTPAVKMNIPVSATTNKTISSNFFHRLGNIQSFAGVVGYTSTSATLF